LEHCKIQHNIIRHQESFRPKMTFFAKKLSSRIGQSSFIIVFFIRHSRSILSRDLFIGANRPNTARFINNL